MRNLITIFLLTITLYGCADSARIVQDEGYVPLTISKTSTAYVSIPKDGSYGTSIYSGSGQSVASIIRSALLTHLVEVNEGNEYEAYKQALYSSQNSGADYLFFPSILHWEDRATEWSGIPDKAEIKIVVIEVKTGNKVSSATINGSSGLATFGGDHPQDLLPEPVEKYVDSIFK